MKQVVVIIGLFAVAAAQQTTNPRPTKQPGVIENPDPDYRDGINRCYVCDPASADCANRVDCCLETKPEQIQACYDEDKTACWKKVRYEAPFNRISRGCGKIPSVAISDDACKEVGTEGKEWDCNCNMHECNAAPIDLLGAGLMLVAAVFYLLA